MISRSSLTLLALSCAAAGAAITGCAHQPHQTVMAPVGSPEEGVDAKAKNKAAQSREDQVIALNAGLLGAMNEPSGALSNVFGSIDLGEADLSGSIEGLIGSKGTQLGSGGLGLSASGLGGGGGHGGLGGGGADVGLGGIGGIGIKGSGVGGSGLGGVNKTVGVQLQVDSVVVVGALDKEVILRVLRSRQNQLRYCYDRELVKDPNIGKGSLKVHFKINEGGRVVGAEIADAAPFNKAVADCAVTALGRIVFPAPAGGTVKVTHTLIFKRADP